MNNEFDIYQSNFQADLNDEDLKKQLAHVLAATNFSLPGTRYEGKVRDSYITGDVRYLVTTDRFSCFDVVLTTVPFKGQVLNQLAVDWFERAKDIVAHHLVDVPHPNVMVARNVEILPVEVVVRGYLAGSAWRDYQAGKSISGIRLPAGCRSSQQLETPLVTPSTKAELGLHDEPISEEEILARKLVAPAVWEEVKETALALFALGQERAAANGLLLADTKYEFGLLHGKLVLADEIHTLDSSRYWIADSYAERFEKGEVPAMLDKEPTRQWLLAQGYSGNGLAPVFSDEHRIALARHYISSFERITGSVFRGQIGDVQTSIETALAGDAR